MTVLKQVPVSAFWLNKEFPDFAQWRASPTAACSRIDLCKGPDRLLLYSLHSKDKTDFCTNQSRKGPQPVSVYVYTRWSSTGNSKIQANFRWEKLKKNISICVLEFLWTACTRGNHLFATVFFSSKCNYLAHFSGTGSLEEIWEAQQCKMQNPNFFNSSYDDI